MPYDPVACAVVCIVLYVVAVVSIALRFYVRFYLLNNISTDDYLAGGAAILYTGVSLTYILGALRYGVGRYASDAVFIGELLYFVTTYLVKLSFIFTLFRIVTTHAHRVALFLLAGSGFVVTTFTFFWAVFFCDPVRYFWTQGNEFAHTTRDNNESVDQPAGSCKSVTALMVVVIIHAAWTLIADLTLGLVLPAVILWSSQMRTRVKVSVGVLLGLGSTAAIATIIRIVYLPSISLSESLLTNNPVIFWSIVESAVGVIASAGSTWRPLLKGDSVLSGSGSSRAERYNNTGSNGARFSGAGSRVSRAKQISMHIPGFEGGGGGGERGRRLGSLTEEEEGILLDRVGKGGFVQVV
ncbi:hypothetical protein BJY01DRAFT_253744 [Aspergillus pseudoustus]|uniref:Rhodopsin domain-containing protein n=1 Tax=Aspergillus pseudoustus TaxID=1810923 RepID=A0ABR4IZT8_9EURO